MKRLISILTALFLFAGAVSAQTKTKLAEAEAAAGFERFADENGYTDLPPAADKSKIVPEPVNGGTDEFALRPRKNRLWRTPYRPAKGSGLFGDGRTELFFSTKISVETAKNFGPAWFL